jgi:protein-S-isoprenylcysteine O-methyltransferase Ste14
VRLLLNIAWLIGSVYATIPALWLTIHPFVGYWRTRPGAVMGRIGLIWFGLIAVLLVLTFTGHEAQIYTIWWSWLVWLLLFAVGLGLYRKLGGFGLARVIGQAEVRPEEHAQKLITSGMHARVRHPIYLAHWLMLTAWTIGAGTIALIAMWVFATITGMFMLRAEESELRSRFGFEWDEYASRVPMILPRI